MWGFTHKDASILDEAQRKQETKGIEAQRYFFLFLRFFEQQYCRLKETKEAKETDTQ